MNSFSGPFVLGSDIGTSGCKSIIMDAQGQICGWSMKSYKTVSLFPGWAEQDPYDWYDAFCETTREAIQQANADPDEISMVCIVGITHNAVLLDQYDRVLRTSIIYTDIRSLEESEVIKNSYGDEIFKRTLNKVGPLWTWPQLLWIRENEREIWSQTKRILFPKDFVRHCISPSFISDTIDPVGTLLFDPLKRKWIHEFLESLGFPENGLPTTQPATQIVGEVTPDAAAATGLKPGTPVLTGTTDTAAEVFGVGALSSGQAVIKLATVGRIMAISTVPLPNPEFLNYPHVIDGLWYPGTTTKFAASAFSWAKRAFWDDGDQMYEYKIMDQTAESVPIGSGGILFHPYLAGEFAPSWDPYLRASFLGIGRDHTRAHFTRAVMEGVGFAIRHALESVLSMGLEVDEVRLIGGGAESRLWSQIIADILNRDIRVPVGTDAAFGAALMAGIGAGFFEMTADSISNVIKFRSDHSPSPESNKIYSELFKIYTEAACNLQGISHKLHYLQTNLKDDNLDDQNSRQDSLSSSTFFSVPEPGFE
jgi:xylulokinase